MITQITLLFNMLVFSALMAYSQQIVIRDKTTDYAVIKSGSGNLLISNTNKNYVADNKWSTIRKANSQDFKNKKEAWKYMLPNYLYSQTPSGSIIWRKTKGEFYQSNDVNSIPVKVSIEQPEFTADENGENSVYFTFSTDSIGYAYLDMSGKIYRTNDGGKNWHYQGTLVSVCADAHAQGFIRKVHFITPNVGFAWIQMNEKVPFAQIASNDFAFNRLARTDDGGVTWQEVEIDNHFTKTYSLGDVYFYAEGADVSIYSYGDNVVYHSTDKGLRFLAKNVMNHKQKWNISDNSGKLFSVDSQNYKPFKIIFLH